MLNEQKVFFPGWMHILKLLLSSWSTTFSWSQGLFYFLIDLAFCWLWYVKHPISHEHLSSWVICSEKAQWLHVSALVRSGFWQTLQAEVSELPCLIMVPLSGFRLEEREGAVIIEACKWKANSTNDTEAGCSLLVFKCDDLTFVLCWPLQIASSFEPLDFRCCTPPLQHIWAHLILREIFKFFFCQKQ